MFPVILHTIIFGENSVLASGEILQLNAQQYVFGMGPWYCGLNFFFFPLKNLSNPDNRARIQKCKEVVKKEHIFNVYLQIKCVK